MPRRRTRISTGIYRDRWGLAAVVEVRGAGRKERRYSRQTPIRTIQEWRVETRSLLLKRRKRQAARGTLSADIPKYITQLKGTLATWKDREREIRMWEPRFGHLHRNEFANQIPQLNEQLRMWRQEYAASTVNHFRDALSHLFKVLDGRAAAHDLDDLIRFRPERAPRPWRNRASYLRVLKALPTGTKTRARLLLMFWTGMRPSQMGRLTPDGPFTFYLRTQSPYVLVPRGKGGRIAAIPLLKDGAQVAREFIRLEAWGSWSCPMANKAIAAAAKRVGEAPFTCYALRHSFAQALRRSGADVADIQDLYGHTDAATTLIYATPSIEKHRDAIRRLQNVR